VRIFKTEIKTDLYSHSHPSYPDPFKKYLFLILFKDYFEINIFFFFNKRLIDSNFTSEIHFLHLYLYFEINHLFHFHDFTFFYQRYFITFSSFLLDLSFFSKRIYYLFCIVDIHISLSYSILLSRTTIFVQIFKFSNSTIRTMSNKHVSRTIETETNWLTQLIGL
jgi:hypothetical protein